MHELTITLGPERSNGILFFHAFTGCDIVSSFSGKSKKSAWHTWDVCPEASDVFTKLSSYPTHVEKEDIERLEKFVVRMYDRSSSTEAVDDARLELFSRKQRSYEAVPPTRSALVQHIRRAAYQSACIRGTGLWSVGLKRRILHNGAGNKKKTSGVSYGWSFHQLLRVVSNLLNASARPSVEDVASVTSLV